MNHLLGPNLVKGLNGTPKKRQYNDQMDDLAEALRELDRKLRNLKPVLEETEAWIKEDRKRRQLPQEH